MTAKKEHLFRMGDWHGVVIDEGTQEEPPPPAPEGSRRVEHTGRRVVAYFDVDGNPTEPELAVTAKVWTPDGRVRVLTLTEEDINAGD